MGNIINKFGVGRSGAVVTLEEVNGSEVVVKSGLRDVPGVVALHELLEFDKPEIVCYSEDSITMEYIRGVSIATFLNNSDTRGVHKLIDYLGSYFDWCANRSCTTDYSVAMQQKVIDLEPYVTLDISVTPTTLLGGPAHGDFTFDNLIYANNRFYMIDLSPNSLSSVQLDANKLRQDLNGYWFMRDRYDTNIALQCNTIYTELKRMPAGSLILNYFGDLFNTKLYKFQYSRVLPYCKYVSEREYILKEIESL